jgi:hypothetical protein
MLLWQDQGDHDVTVVQKPGTPYKGGLQQEADIEVWSVEHCISVLPG